MADEFMKRREKHRVRSTHEFKNEFGNVIERKFFNKNLELRSMYKYEYDEKNLLIKETRYTGDEEIRYLINYKYDENGNLVEYFAYDSKSKPAYKKIYIYKNNILVQQRGYNLGVELRYKTLYFYDTDGYKIIEQHFNAENKLNFVSVFDRSGELFEIISPKGDSEIKISDKNRERNISHPYPYLKSIVYKTCSGLDDVEDQYKFEYFDETEK
jgi:hypothetical protein